MAMMCLSNVSRLFVNKIILLFYTLLYTLLHFLAIYKKGTKNDAYENDIMLAIACNNIKKNILFFFSFKY